MSRAPGPAEVGSAANSYEILAKLAMGGMAEIFLARGASAAGVERYVVLKRVLRHRAGDQAFIGMFLDEARLAAQLQHPNIAQVYDIGKLGDSYFFTMEYVHGETVRTLLQRSHALRRPIPLSATLTVVAGAAAGLQHAHERKGMDGRPLGIVHRDVSPSNLMVSYEGTVKVVDFGVAKAAHRDTETRSGTVKGKITYMSPEQCKGGDIDRRSDLFSLGIVMWEMLTTERLFRRNSDFENMQAIVAEDVPPPSSLRPEIPPDVDRVVMKLLAKRVSDRYQTADEVHEDIENAAVRTGSALSAASLGRFMRELFGQRPEPWIELQSNDSHPEAFTVTSEPIAAPPPMPSPADELDAKLANVPQLSQRLTAQAPVPNMPVDRPVQPTVPLRVHAEELAVTHQRMPNVVPMPYSTPPVGTAHMPQPTLPMPTAAPLAMPPSYSASQPSAHAMRPHTPSMTPPSSPQYPVLPSSQAALYGGTMSQPSLTQPKPRSRAMLILVPAVILGVVIGIVLAVDGDDNKPADTANTVAAGADEQPIPTATDQPAEPAAEPTTQPTTDTLTTAPTDAATAPPIAAPIDAGSTAPVPTGSAASTETSKPVEAAPPPVEADKKPVSTKKHDKTATADKDDVATLYKAGKYDDAVDECNSSSRIVALNATVCTLAACKARETSKAKRWFASVGSAKRSSVIKECGGVLPAEKPAGPIDEKERCRRDPMSCQH